MSEEKKNDKPVPPGWNDPPPISPASGITRTGRKLNQRVAYPLSSGSNTPTSPMSTPRSDGPPITPRSDGPPITPRSDGPPITLRSDAPPINPRPISAPPLSTPPIAAATIPPKPALNTVEEEKLLEELKGYIQSLADAHGKDKTAEINHRFEIMANMWPNLDQNTKSYATEAIRGLHENNLEAAKDFHEKLVQECGMNAVHWVLMIKLLINNMSAS